jgi:hypothetical protein
MRYPDDLITVIFREMDIEDKPIRFKEEIIYNTIFKYSGEYPELFEDFTFHTTGTFPYSDLLERIIERYKISRILKTENPDFEYVSFKAGINQQIDAKIKKRFEPKELEILKAIGNDLRSKLRA